jgi:hypothetical protein
MAGFYHLPRNEAFLPTFISEPKPPGYRRHQRHSDKCDPNKTMAILSSKILLNHQKPWACLSRDRSHILSNCHSPVRGCLAEASNQTLHASDPALMACRHNIDLDIVLSL